MVTTQGEEDTSNVVSIDSFRKETCEKNFDMFSYSNEVLDAIEENFDYGVYIGIQNGKMNVSATINDVDEIIFILEEALEYVREDY